ncbi:MAG: hypothetical protein KDC80_02920 [Saprospiraceae bacterium]|nr:hypothetical protein [Saprospiraceae bacterium]
MRLLPGSIYRLMSIILCVSFLRLETVVSQDAEVPAIINFSKEAYSAQKQNWQIAQLENGLMLFANTGGLMSYNGVNWKQHTMPHQEILRTLLVDQNRIYAGSYGEFGFWEPDHNGHLSYTSLTRLIDREVTASEEIWNIVKSNQAIYFHSFGVVFKYDGEKLSRIVPPYSIRFMHPFDHDRYILQVTGHGIMLFENDLFKPFIPEVEVSSLKVTGISPAGAGAWVIASEKNGLFLYRNGQVIPWETEVDDLVQEHQINKMLALKQGGWAIGTISDGLLILDPEGKLKYHINKNSGLQNNTVLSLFEDSASNLWVGLDDGVDLIDLQSPIIFYRDNSGRIGTLFDAIEFRDQLYIGTNQGLFRRDRTKPLSQDPFTLIPGSQGQVLQLKNIDGDLVCGHNNGTFVLNDRDELEPVSRVSGGWDLKRVPNHPEKMIQGTYTGLILMHKELGHWKHLKTLHEFTGGAKELEFDHQKYLWVANPYRGLHRIKIDFSQDTILEVKSYSESDGLPTDYNISIINMGGRIIFHCEAKYFTFDEGSERFQPYEFELPANTPYQKIIPLQDSLLFLIREKQLEVIKRDKHLGQFGIHLVRGSEHIVPLDDETFLVCLESGYAIIDLKAQPNEIRRNGRITMDGFKAWDKSGALVYDVSGDIIEWEKKIELPPRINRLELSFASFDYSHERPFRYQLTGFDLDWSPWSLDTRKEYTNLAPGQYEFKLQYEDLEPAHVLTITQIPAWYQTLTARIIFVMAIAAIVWLLILYYDNQLKAHTRRLQIEKEREINRQRLALQNQLLEKEINHKSQELANSTMNIIQKNKALLTLKDQITDIRDNLGRQFPDKQYHQIIRLIQQHMSSQDDWKLFETNFNDVHDDFFRTLKQDYPDLTAGDLRLAAYLKMNLTSKEIAPLLNISIRGVENKRYRLRQKMGLNHDENILDILLQY